MKPDVVATWAPLRAILIKEFSTALRAAMQRQVSRRARQQSINRVFHSSSPCKPPALLLPPPLRISSAVRPIQHLHTLLRDLVMIPLPAWPS